jgi:hypothetical protein
VDKNEIEKSLASSFDRFEEAHFWIHQLELSYHFANPFRYHFNAFLKAIKEVPCLLSTELQNHDGFPAWFRNERKKLQENRLLSFLSKQRDFVVHRGMLVPKSHGGIGITEGRGIKLGFSLSINPLMDSDAAMDRFIFVISTDGKDPFGVLTEDEESMPCVHREWKLEAFDEELVELATKAWLQTGETVGDVVRWLGAKPPELKLGCRHSTQEVQFKLYDRKALKARLREFKKLRNPIKKFAKISPDPSRF